MPDYIHHPVEALSRDIMKSINNAPLSAEEILNSKLMSSGMNEANRYYLISTAKKAGFFSEKITEFRKGFQIRVLLTTYEYSKNCNIPYKALLERVNGIAGSDRNIWDAAHVIRHEILKGR